MHVCTDGIVITRGEHDIPVDKIRRGCREPGKCWISDKKYHYSLPHFHCAVPKVAVFYLVAEENLQNEHSSMLF